MAATSQQIAQTVQKTAEPITVSKELLLRELTADQLGEWDDLVQRSPQGSVFCQSWWLEATCGTPRVLGLFDGDRLVAGLPLYYKSKFGVTLCTMPKLTQTWGVVLEPLTGRTCRVLTRQMELLRPFATHLSRLTFFYQRFHSSLTNWLPFCWSGFVQTSRVTYVLDDLSCHDEIMKGMTHQIRGEIKKAERLGIEISRSTGSELWDFTLKTFGRQHKIVSFDKEYLERICTASQARDQGACFAAVDREGRTHAAGLVVWDCRRAYYLVSGADPALRTSGAGSLLAWHNIQFASQRASVFDFEGTMLEGVERFFRDFGARQVQFNCILKYPAWAYPYLRRSKNL